MEHWSKIPGEIPHMGLSENSVPLHPMVLLIIIPTKWLFHWGYTPFSDIPMCHAYSVICPAKATPPFQARCVSSEAHHRNELMEGYCDLASSRQAVAKFWSDLDVSLQGDRMIHWKDGRMEGRFQHRLFGVEVRLSEWSILDVNIYIYIYGRPGREAPEVVWNTSSIKFIIVHIFKCYSNV